MEWEGVAMVEYRFDPDTRSAYLMEVNGRFWGSLPLAQHAGADFPTALVNAARGEPNPPANAYRVGVRCRNLSSDTRWVLTSLREGSTSRAEALTSYARDFRPGVRYFVWQWSDPMPVIVSIGSGLRKRLGGAALRYLGRLRSS